VRDLRAVAVAAALLVAGGALLILFSRDRDTVGVPGSGGRLKSSASKRAERRAYDGAPPVVPHQDFSASCVVCHTTTGIEVQGVGFSPPMPHALTPGLGATSNCRQCHAFKTVETVFVESGWSGLPQDLRRGERMYPGAPPVVPHGHFMREDCAACHTGPAAREEIRCKHPERIRCTQCHVQARTSTLSPFE
jgi:cytochrome c-type protein NapB